MIRCIDYGKGHQYQPYQSYAPLITFNVRPKPSNQTKMSENIVIQADSYHNQDPAPDKLKETN